MHDSSAPHHYPVRTPHPGVTRRRIWPAVAVGFVAIAAVTLLLLGTPTGRQFGRRMLVTGVNATSKGPWNMRYAGCFVDADGDGIDDLVGLVERDGETRVTVLGGDGMVQWQSNGSRDIVALHCIDEDHFAVVDDERRIYVARADAPGAMEELEDAESPVQRLARNDDCLELETGEGELSAHPLPGEGGRCRPERLKPRNDVADWPEDDRPLESAETKAIMGPDDAHVFVTRGERKVALRVGEGGRMELYAEGFATEGMRVIPDFEVGRSASVDCSSDRIFVWGQHAVKTEFSNLIIYDAETGDTVRDLGISTTLTGLSREMRRFHYNGRYLVVVFNDEVCAYEPEDGREAWCFGWM